MLQSTQAQSPGPWAIVIFASRESVGVLLQAVQAAGVAGRGRAQIDVLVNGNPGLAAEFAARMAGAPPVAGGPAVNIWSIAQGDKANAWNQYIHRIWAGQALSFFIDGYVRLNPDAVALLGDALVANPSLLGGTGMPSTGRTAAAAREKMAEQGGFHGNFCCITGPTIAQLRQRHIALPLGLYRVDSLMGALLSFNLNPANNDWNHRRILVHPTASWQTEAKHWWRPADLKARFKRTLRQAKGLLENEAVKQFLEREQLPPETLPTTASALVNQWLQHHPVQARRFMRQHPLTFFALKDISKPIDWSDATRAPTLAWSGRSAKGVV